MPSLCRSLSRHQGIHNQRDKSNSHYCPRHRRHFSRLQSCPHFYRYRNRSSSFRRHTLYSFSSNHSSSCCPSANGSPITPHTMIPTDIVTLHPTLTTSLVGATHATPWTSASLIPAALATQHNDLSSGKSNSAQDPQSHINSTALKLSPSRIPLQIFHWILTATLIL